MKTDNVKIIHMDSHHEKQKVLLGISCNLPSESKENNEITNSHTEFISQLTNTLDRFQNIKTTIYLSSNLISHIDKKFSDFSSRFRKLLDKNQIELLSGGKYEPIFPFIPKDDRQAQLSLMNRLINHIYGYIPSGAWVTEHAWEPSLTIDLAKSKIQYICLPKEHFTSVGLEEDKLNGYFITEDEGRKIGVFPITYKLHDLAVKHSPQEAVDFILNKTTNREDSSIVLIYERLKDNKNTFDWIKGFLEILTSKSETLEMNLFHNYFHSHKPKGRIYIPIQQNINSKNISETWKYFLLKYHEANLLHKKMLRVSKKVHAAREGKSRFKVIKEMIKEAHELLLKGQNISSYWDERGGIYSPSSRYKAYSYLIKAENLIDSASRHGSKWIQVSETDYDCDGNDEIIIETDTQNIYISPALGGGILEYDFRPKNINLTNTISRIKEPYHVNSEHKLLQNGNLKFDPFPKVHLLDHFLEANLNPEQLTSNNLKPLTKKNVNFYNVEKIKAKEETCKVTLNFKETLTKLDNSPEIELRKQISTRAGDSSVVYDYALTNRSSSSVALTFAVELNLNITAGYDENSYFYLNGNKDEKTANPNLKAQEEINNINQISIHNNIHKIDLALSWNKACKVLRCPIETISHVNGELQKVFQGNTIFLLWDLSLEPATPIELSIKQEITNITDEL